MQRQQVGMLCSNVEPLLLSKAPSFRHFLHTLVFTYNVIAFTSPVFKWDRDEILHDCSSSKYLHRLTESDDVVGKYKSRLYVCCWCNADSKAAVSQLAESDIAALTGLVKLYFRELPDGLLTDQVYGDIDKAMGLSRKSLSSSSSSSS